MKFRMERVDLEMKNALSTIISQMDDSRLAGTFVTITDVKTAPDLYNSRISISSFGQSEITKVIEALNSSKGYIRRELAGQIKIKRIPDLVFVEDKTEQKANRIEELLGKIANKK